MWQASSTQCLFLPVIPHMKKAQSFTVWSRNRNCLFHSCVQSEQPLGRETTRDISRFNPVKFNLAQPHFSRVWLNLSFQNWSLLAQSGISLSSSLHFASLFFFKWYCTMLFNIFAHLQASKCPCVIECSCLLNWSLSGLAVRRVHSDIFTNSWCALLIPLLEILRSQLFVRTFGVKF